MEMIETARPPLLTTDRSPAARPPSTGTLGKLTMSSTSRTLTAEQIQRLLLDLTDAGNATILAHLYGDSLRYDHARRRWLVWTGHWWQPDATGEVTRFAIKVAEWRLSNAMELLGGAEFDSVARFAGRSRNRAKIEAALWMACRQPPFADDGLTWDMGPFLLGVANGIIDLRTGELQGGRPEDRITMHSPVADVAGFGGCPRWLQFLDEVFCGDEDLIGFVHRAIGYSLTGDTSEQTFFLLHGSGANGKSILLSVLRHVLGPYAFDPGFSVFEASRHQPHPEALASLAGKRLVTASETAENSRLNEARIKSLSHGDPTSARFMYGNRFEFTPCCKLWLAVNHLPRVADDSHGFWRSARLIPFERQFTGKDADPHLLDQLISEAPGILAWAVDGCIEWQATRLGEPPSAVAVATGEWQSESDPLAGFLSTNCVEGPGCWTPTVGLYGAYCEFAAGEGVPERERLTHRQFARRLGHRYRSAKRRHSGKLVSGYEGVGLATD
jgi:putative DNA primase/helicase